MLNDFFCVLGIDFPGLSVDNTQYDWNMVGLQVSGLFNGLLDIFAPAARSHGTAGIFLYHLPPGGCSSDGPIYAIMAKSMS